MLKVKGRGLCPSSEVREFLSFFSFVMVLYKCTNFTIQLQGHSDTPHFSLSPDHIAHLSSAFFIFIFLPNFKLACLHFTFQSLAYQHISRRKLKKQKQKQNNYQKPLLILGSINRDYKPASNPRISISLCRLYLFPFSYGVIGLTSFEE